MNAACGLRDLLAVEDAGVERRVVLPGLRRAVADDDVAGDDLGELVGAVHGVYVDLVTENGVDLVLQLACVATTGGDDEDCLCHEDYSPGCRCTKIYI